MPRCHKHTFLFLTYTRTCRPYYTHTHFYTHKHTDKHTHTHTHVQAVLHTHTLTHTYTHKNAYTHTSIPYYTIHGGPFSTFFRHCSFEHEVLMFIIDWSQGTCSPHTHTHTHTRGHTHNTHKSRPYYTIHDSAFSLLAKGCLPDDPPHLNPGASSSTSLRTDSNGESAIERLTEGLRQMVRVQSSGRLRDRV